MSHHLVLYDGVCGLCNRLIRIIIAGDPDNQFRFASLQSKLGKEILGGMGIQESEYATFYLVTGYNQSDRMVLQKATASLFIAKRLGFPWNILLVTRLFPMRWLDKAYDFVARNRYRYFGKYETCPLPPEEQRERFLDI